MSAVATDVAFRRFAERACADEKLELEVGIDMLITMPMFRRLIQTLETDLGRPPIDTLQLDVIKDSMRMEYHGKDLIEQLIGAANKVVGTTVTPSRILVKRREMSPVSHGEYEYTVRLKREMDVVPDSAARETNLGAFRLKRRFSFCMGMCQIDCTVVQEKKRSERREPARASWPIKFEVEVEFVGARSPISASHSEATVDTDRDPDAIVRQMTSIVVRCLGVMLGTSQPVPRSIRLAVAGHLCHKDGDNDTLDERGERAGTPPKVSSDLRLVGPQPVTLEMHHIAPNARASNIWDGDYTVTDKADGVRCQLVVVDRRAYTLDSSGTLRLVAVEVPSRADGCLLDGELITRSRDDEPLNMFVAFDVYRMGGGGKSCAHLPLVPRSASDPSRCDAMAKMVELIARARSIDDFQVGAKRFLAVRHGTSSISDAMAAATGDEHARPYATDGLIFTPARLAVGARYDGDAPKLEGAWPLAFKWKPPECNTIDFLLRPCKEFQSESGSMVLPLAGADPTGHYKVYEAHVSYIPRKWESLDVSRYMQFGERAFPGRDAEARKFETIDSPDGARVYIAVDVLDQSTCEDGSVVYGDDTIVECAYRLDGGEGRWIALRVRQDKTDRYARSGIAGSANDRGTALNVWRSIRHPITLEMLTGDQPPSAPVAKTDPVAGEGDPYYVARAFERKRSMLHAMANFHNVVVKSQLYSDAATNCAAAGPASLFEMACGKGGDIPRWASHRFDPIVGIDSSMDNIVNSIDGIYARLAPHRASLEDRTLAFVCMDATTRMRPPLDEIRVAASDSPHGDVIAALWDTSSRAMTNTALTPLRGIIARGFDVVSCQFAMHYMFQDDLSLDRFVRNLDHLLRPGGVFIASCFDGDRIAQALERTKDGQMLGVTAGGAVAWRISKGYDGDFDGGTGAAIDVFIETINQTVREYLVSARTLEARLRQVGLQAVSAVPFSAWFAQSPTPLSDLERRLSAFNTAFVFKRVDGSDRSGTNQSTSAISRRLLTSEEDM